MNPYLTQRSFTPPATPFETQQFRAAVVQFASENGMINFDFDGFLKSCEASDWKTTRGSRMTCWRQAVRKYNQYKGTGEKRMAKLVHTRRAAQSRMLIQNVKH